MGSRLAGKVASSFVTGVNLVIDAGVTLAGSLNPRIFSQLEDGQFYTVEESDRAKGKAQ